MIDFDQAMNLMKNYVAEQQKLTDPEILMDGNDFVIVDDFIERHYGWVFYYQPKKFIETGEIQYSILGNSPVLINKEDGSMYDLGTHRSIESALRDYESGKDIYSVRIC
jgi:Immunity protein 35